MILVYIIILIIIILCMIPSFSDDTNWIYLIAGLFAFFSLMVTFAIRTDRNPEQKNYYSILHKYEYISTHDSIPYEMRTDLYTECAKFNEILHDYDKYHDNNWIGFYYPEIGKDRLEFDYFNINKIK